MTTSTKFILTPFASDSLSGISSTLSSCLSSYGENYDISNFIEYKSMLLSNQLCVASCDLSTQLYETSCYLSTALCSKIWIEDRVVEGEISGTSDLSVIKLSKEEFDLCVAINLDRMSSDTIYFVDSNYIDAYGQAISNVIMSSDGIPAIAKIESEATNKNYVDALCSNLSNEIDSHSTKLSGEIDSLSTKLSGEIDSLSTKLSGEIDQIISSKTVALGGNDASHKDTKTKADNQSVVIGYNAEDTDSASQNTSVVAIGSGASANNWGTAVGVGAKAYLGLAFGADAVAEGGNNPMALGRYAKASADGAVQLNGNRRDDGHGGFIYDADNNEANTLKFWNGTKNVTIINSDGDIPKAVSSDYTASIGPTIKINDITYNVRIALTTDKDGNDISVLQLS